MNDYEIEQVCDAIKRKDFDKGETIIKEGELGNDFFILKSGTCHAVKTIDGEEKSVMSYEKGSYFGELALIKNEPRAASIIALEDCSCISIDRMSFKRLLGPLENILNRNSESYEKYIKK